MSLCGFAPADLEIRSPEHAALEAARDDVRVFAIFLDDYHIEKKPDITLRVRRALKEFVRQFAANDLIAVMDPLRFGPLDDVRSRWIAEGVVSGISGYGNSVGVPTVGGEVDFDETYAGNPLVNVLCLGVMPVERLVLGRAKGEGNLAALVESLPGRRV